MASSSDRTMNERKQEMGGLNHEGGQPANEPPRQGRTVSHVPLPQYMKLANPGPLGLLAFALTTFALGLYECGAG